MAIVSLHNAHPCQHCLVSNICLAGREQFTEDMAARSHRVYKRKEVLIGAGQSFNGIYALRSGSAKSYVSIDYGQEQITAFHYPGEIIGVDGLGSNQYLRSVEFLETSSVCFFGEAELKRLMDESPTTRERMFKALNKVIAQEHELLLCLNQYRSEQRLAKLLLDLSDNFRMRGLVANVFDLTMTRTDIANHLGLAIETVSRLLTRFQQCGAIEVHNRQIKILSRELLVGFRQNGCDNEVCQTKRVI